MSKPRSRLSSEPPSAKGGDEPTTSSPFRALTKKLLAVPLDKVRAEEKRLKKANKGRRRTTGGLE